MATQGNQASRSHYLCFAISCRSSDFLYLINLKFLSRAPNAGIIFGQGIKRFAHFSVKISLKMA